MVVYGLICALFEFIQCKDGQIIGEALTDGLLGCGLIVLVILNDMPSLLIFCVFIAQFFDVLFFRFTGRSMNWEYIQDFDPRLLLDMDFSYIFSIFRSVFWIFLGSFFPRLIFISRPRCDPVSFRAFGTITVTICLYSCFH
jgi:hypothetical protein